jgi:hypothetical protein
MPGDMPEDMPGRIPEDMPDRMPGRMPEDMSDRMPEDLPLTRRINVMVGITRSKAIVFGFLLATFFFFGTLFGCKDTALVFVGFIFRFLGKPAGKLQS